MDTKKIQRINLLYNKSKAEGLTEPEKIEQAKLRQEYIDAVKRNFRTQLDNIEIVDNEKKPLN